MSVPLDSLIMGCIFCGSPKVGINVQKTKEGKVSALIFCCAEHMAMADSLVIMRPQTGGGPSGN